VAQGTAARDAWMGILDHARADLRFEKSEMPAEEARRSLIAAIYARKSTDQAGAGGKRVAVRRG